MKRIALLSALPLLAFASPAAAQMKPAGAPDILEAIEMCKSISTPVWMHRDRLEDSDWHTAEVRGERRRTRKVPGIYEKLGNRAYVVLTREELRNRECVVQARLEETSAYMPLLQEISQTTGMPTGQDGYGYTWELDDYNMRVEPTGERSAPSVRFVISTIPMVGTDDILAAVDACVAATGATRLEADALAPAGWTKRTEFRRKDSDGSLGIVMFESAENAAIVSSRATGDDFKDCRVSGRLESEETAENLRAALTGKFGTPSADDDKLNWSHDGRSLRLMTFERANQSGAFAFQIPVSYVGETE